MEHKPTQRAEYQSYLLRLWREGPTGGWRASLEDTATRQRQAFASFDLLVEFLQHQLRRLPSTNPASPQWADELEKEKGHEKQNA